MSAAAVSPAGRAHADADKLVLMREPTPYTDVLDASDEDDRFDLNAHLSYLRTIDRGTIEREYTTLSGQRQRGAVAESKQVRSQLMLGLDVGLYKDLMAFLRVPLVLGDARSIGVPSGKRGDQVTPLLQDPGDFASGDGTLFGLPLDSPERAGFDYVALGVAVGLTSQERKPWLPTWTLLLEGRRAVGTLMRPCEQVDGKTNCGAVDVEDLDNDGEADGTSSLEDKTGVGRGVSSLGFETRVSKRMRYVEPYAGLGALIEWASTARKYFQPGGDLKGYRDTQPSRQFSATLGAELVPWEHRGRFQRVAIDFRLNGTYFTRGRDYSVLYDALGTSGHAALARPNFEGVRNASSSGELHPCRGSDDDNCYVGEAVPFYGLTNQSSRLRYGARLGLDIRAARYVRLAFGTGLSAVTSHSLTSADPCNLERTDSTRSQAPGGQSCGTHPINPSFRATIDSPGRRFWMTSELIFDLYASVMAQF